jgi:hypothetical protein
MVCWALFLYIRTGIGAEADFLKLDNMCLRVVFYDEKQFINQSYKMVVQHKIITINHHFDLRSQTLIQVSCLNLRVEKNV